MVLIRRKLTDPACSISVGYWENVVFSLVACLSRRFTESTAVGARELAKVGEAETYRGFADFDRIAGLRQS